MRTRKRTVVTFLGYSDADYEDREAMLQAAGSILDKFDPRTVNASDHVFAIGGGEVSRVEYLSARRAGKPATFVAANMNHAIASKRAASRSLPAPTDFRGALGADLAEK